MKAMNVYLNFEGNTRAAMEFYKKCFGGELFLMTFADAPGDLPKDPTRIMHATLRGTGFILQASDAMAGANFKQGNNFSLSVSPESIEETEKLFSAIAENGKITMPLQETFWATRFGMLTDQFGIQWLFNFDKPKE